MARDACSREEAQARIDAQMPLDDKKTLADFVIDNSGERSHTREQVSQLYEQLLNP